MRMKALHYMPLSHLHVNPFRTKTPKYLFQEEINLYCVIKLQQIFLYFHYKSVKPDVLCRQINYEHLAILSNLKKLPICT